MNITEETLNRMTVKEFDALNITELAKIRNEFPKEYKRLCRKSIWAASPFRRHRRKTK